MGYCGMTMCIKGCVLNEWEECNGIVGLDGMHYWHAYFMTDTLRSAIEELQHENGTNQEHHTDCDELLDVVRILMKKSKRIGEGRRSAWSLNNL